MDGPQVFVLFSPRFSFLLFVGIFRMSYDPLDWKLTYDWIFTSFVEILWLRMNFKNENNNKKP